MRRCLDNCRALITGASSGIGRAIALELAARHASLVLVARREARLIEVQTDVVQRGGQAQLVVGDVTNSADRLRAIELCGTQLGGIDVLINNAGIGGLGPFADGEASRLQRILDVNFVAPVELIRLVLPLLRESRGAIVNMGSVLGHCAVPHKSEYCASKFALHGFSDALRAELSRDGIQVTLISPSTTASEFFDRVDGAVPQKRRRGMSPAKVAQATIRAAERGTSEVILPLEGKLLVLANRIWPSMVNRFLARLCG